MSYSAEISRANPSCFLFLIDQSGSMADTFAGSATQKAQSVADIINRLISRLVVSCSKQEGVRNYFDVGVIGYGGRVGFVWEGTLAGNEVIPISQLADNPLRIEERTRKVSDHAGGLVDERVKFPVWFDPVAENGTPMCAAIELANEILTKWVSQHPTSYPPRVLHVTDGEATDGDPRAALEKLTLLGTEDGNVLLFNVHLSANENAAAISFPGPTVRLPDEYAQLLFDTASPLPSFFCAVASDEYSLKVDDGAKAFVLNADVKLAVEALEIGTRPANLR